MDTIMRYNPWGKSRGIQDAQLSIQGLLEKTMAQWSPRVDIDEKRDMFRVIADIPGVNPKDIKLNVENGVMTIQGERKSEIKTEDGFSRTERFSGNFCRRFSLSDDVDVNRIEAKGKDGVLEITLPKKQSSIPETIEIKVGE